MSSFRKSLGILSAFFFIVGLYWGLAKNPSFSLSFFSFGQPSTTLTLICSEQWLPKGVIERIEKETNYKIQWLNYSTWAELSNLLGNHQGSFDLLCLHSFLAKDLVESKWMDRFEYQSLPESRHIAAEFRSLPFDPSTEYFLPVGWVLNGFLVDRESDSLSWKNLFPYNAFKLTMNYPDLELYWRMRQEGLEIDPEKQGRYNTDPQGFVKKFVSQLGGFKKPTDSAIKAYGPNKVVQASNNVWINEPEGLKEKLKFVNLSDGTSLWFLLVGVGSQSAHKEQARKVVQALLSPKTSTDLRVEKGFAHILSQFDDMPEVPEELKASYVRFFPLRSLRFPDLGLEDLPQWEGMMRDQAQVTKTSGHITGTR